jgi:hypothetical protein
MINDKVNSLGQYYKQLKKHCTVTLTKPCEEQGERDYFEILSSDAYDASFDSYNHATSNHSQDCKCNGTGKITEEIPLIYFDDLMNGRY